MTRLHLTEGMSKIYQVTILIANADNATIIFIMMMLIKVLFIIKYNGSSVDLQWWYFFFDD